MDGSAAAATAAGVSVLLKWKEVLPGPQPFRVHFADTLLPEELRLLLKMCFVVSKNKRQKMTQQTENMHFTISFLARISCMEWKWVACESG